MDSEYMELTELEKEVLVKLAKEGPLSGYDLHLGGRRKRGTREALMSSSHWIEVQKKLLNEGLIRLCGTRNEKYRGRGRHLYFLTEHGAIASMSYGANIDLLERNLEYFKDKEEQDAVKVWIDECKTLGAERIRAIYEILTLKKPSDVQLSLDEAKEILKTLFEHPKWGSTFKSAVKMLKDILGE